MHALISKEGLRVSRTLALVYGEIGWLPAEETCSADSNCLTPTHSQRKEADSSPRFRTNSIEVELEHHTTSFPTQDLERRHSESDESNIKCTLSKAGCYVDCHLFRSATIKILLLRSLQFAQNSAACSGLVVLNIHAPANPILISATRIHLRLQRNESLSQQPCSSLNSSPSFKRKNATNRRSMLFLTRMKTST
jgi:hypothetical protein